MTGPNFGRTFNIRNGKHGCNPGTRDWAGTTKTETTISGGYKNAASYHASYSGSSATPSFPLLYAIDDEAKRMIAVLGPSNFVRIDCDITGPTLTSSTKAYTMTDSPTYAPALLGIVPEDAYDTLNAYYAYVITSGGTNYLRIKKLVWDKSANTMTDTLVHEETFGSNNTYLNIYKTIGDVSYIGVIEFTDGTNTEFYVHWAVLNLQTEAVTVTQEYDSSVTGCVLNSDLAGNLRRMWIVEVGGVGHWCILTIDTTPNLYVVIDGTEHLVEAGASGTYTDWSLIGTDESVSGGGFSRQGSYAEYNQQNFIWVNWFLWPGTGSGGECKRVVLNSSLTPDIDLTGTDLTPTECVAPWISPSDIYNPEFIFNSNRFYPIDVTDGSMGTVISKPTNVDTIQHAFPALDIYDNSIYAFCKMTDTSYKLLKLSSVNCSSIIASYTLSLTNPTSFSSPGAEMRGNWIIRWGLLSPTSTMRVAYLANDTTITPNEILMVLNQT